MEIDRELVERLRAFHGHLGPFAMLGYRAGQLALRRLQAPSHFGISARVSCPPHTPPSCFADGVQCGTGCTLGKGNIEMEPSQDISLTVTVNDSGAACTVVPRPEVIAQFGPWMAESDDETAALRVLEMADEELFIPDS
ncbi:MAG: FmdE family protein [Armatimonadota bacterium]